MFIKSGKPIVKFLFIITFLQFISVLPQEGIAQVKKFGKVDKKEVGNTSIESPAEMIFNYGLFSIKDQQAYDLYRHIRIKVNTREGMNWASFSIPFNEDNGQSVLNIEGQSYTLNEKGKVEKTKLNEADIFVEDLPGDWKRVKFTMPNVKEGSVIEVKYNHRIGDPSLLPDWNFDSTIPVRWSELEAEIPSFLRFSLISRLKSELHINEAKDVSIKFKLDWDPELNRGSYGSSGERGRSWVNARGEKFRWAMKDLPALQKETNVSSLDNYYSKMFLQFTALDIPDQTYVDFAKTWRSISEELDDNVWFGRQLRSEKWSQSLVNSLINSTDDVETRISKIYSYVQSFNWSGLWDFYVDEDLEKVNNKKSGNSAELNLLLVKLFREAGFFSHPVLISTRDNGKLIKDYALPSQFNHVIARVAYQDTQYLLDVLNPYNSYMLPKENLNGEGLAVHEYEPEWVQLKEASSTSTTLKYDMELRTDGSLKGKATLSSKGYDALEMYKTMAEVGRDRFFKNSMSNEFDGEVTGRILKQPSFFEAELEMEIDYDSKGSSAEDSDGPNVIYLNPMMPKLISENPFKSDDRVLPIEFTNTFTRTSQVSIQIPNGYEVESLPEAKNINLPRRSLSYLESYSIDEGAIVIIRRLRIRSTEYSATDYPIIKQTFDDATGANEIRLILKKVDAE